MNPWYLSHRVDLHNELKLLALGEGDGPPAELHLSSAVELIQAEEGIVILENGEKHICDLIVAGDGVRVRSSRFANSFYVKLIFDSHVSHESENKCSIQRNQNQQEKLPTGS
jgi:2-polyprenyl-6-methoxyphenol hydroxylase-like FAD-dependent oxidoreductase